MRFKTLHKYCRRYFKEEVFDPKNCMLDYAMEAKIIKTSELKEDSTDLAKAYANKSMLMPNSDESLKNIQKAYDLFKKLNNKILIAKCYEILGNLHKERGDFEKAKTFKRKYYNNR